MTVGAAEAVTGIVVVDETDTDTEINPEVRAFLEKWIDKIPLEEMLVDLARDLARQPYYSGEDVFIFPESVALVRR